MTTLLDTPRIYVACLASYNNGVLHGKWIDLDGKDVDAVQEEIQRLLTESQFPNVTIACLDCDGLGRHNLLEVEGGDKCSTCAGSGKVAAAEEYAIHDHEGFCGFNIEEYTPIASLVALAEKLNEHGEAFAVYANHIGATPWEVDEDDFTAYYCGEYDSEESYAEEIFDELYLSDIPETARYYINYKAFARDLFINDNWSESGESGQLYVFRH